MERTSTPTVAQPVSEAQPRPPHSTTAARVAAVEILGEILDGTFVPKGTRYYAEVLEDAHRMRTWLRRHMVDLGIL